MKPLFYLSTLTILFLSTQTMATSVEYMNLVSLTDEADFIFRGAVIKHNSFWDENIIFTNVDIQVQECLKGRCPKVITILQPGGQIDDLVQHIEGLQSFEKGEEILLFVQEGKYADRYSVLGLNQGRFYLEMEEDTRMAKQNLDGLILFDGKTTIEHNKVVTSYTYDSIKQSVTHLLRTQ